MNKLIIISLLIGLSTSSFGQFQQKNEVFPTPYERTSWFKFGTSVSINGDYAVIGCPGFNSGRGKVMLLHKNTTGWEKVIEFMDGNKFYSSQFGYSVKITDNLIAIGATNYTPGSAYIEGNEAVYLYEKPETGWQDAKLTAKLNANNLNYFGGFGVSVDIEGDIVIVGAPRAKEYQFQIFKGSVFIFKKPPTGWADMYETAILSPSDSSVSNDYGLSVSISNNVVAVGAKDRGSKGAVYVYQKPAADWVNSIETAVLTASDGSINDYFGKSVSINGDNILIGAPGNDGFNVNAGKAYVFKKPVSGWTTMNETAVLRTVENKAHSNLGSTVFLTNTNAYLSSGTDNDTISGIVYVYQKSVADWASTAETSKLTATGDTRKNNFGKSIGVSGNYAFVGAPLDSVTNINSGKVFVYENTNIIWPNMTENHVVLPIPELSANNDLFGNSVAIDSNFAVVGALGHKSYSGRAFVLEKINEIWEIVAILVPSTEGGDFGNSVDIYGNVVVVGAPYQNTENGYTGAAFVFEKPVNGWHDMTQTAVLTSSNSSEYDNFGITVSIYEDDIVVGANNKDTSSTGYIGCTYLFNKPATGWTDTTESYQLRPANCNKSESIFGEVDIWGNTIISSSYSSKTGSTISVFEKPEEGWQNVIETACLSQNNKTGPAFSIAINNDLILAGNPEVTINGMQYVGQVYMYEKSSTGWCDTTETRVLLPIEPLNWDHFGYSIDISDNLFLIGSHEYGWGNGDVYAYEKAKDGWKNSQFVKLYESYTTGGMNDEFGNAVGISGKNVIIGSQYKNGTGRYSGSVYFFGSNPIVPIDGVEEVYDESAIGVFPNPTDRFVTISVPEDAVYFSVEIFDCYGKSVYNQKHNSTFSLDLSDYSKGIYFVRFSINNTTEIHKILKL